ncbi:MAG: hypothetical protein DMF77_12360 [Acidobacteria bacterium]|nr:MAG: hypothetical protein DMF77_12360 [Acidobacteriota bacterium]
MDLFAGFEWDPQKGRGNIRQHGVDFADAVAMFEDERAITMRDDLTAVDEQRWVTLGRDTRGRILVVAYTGRGDRIRIFSARRATASERRQYLEEDP